MSQDSQKKRAVVAFFGISGVMVRLATRSASRRARAAEAVATGPLGALSHDELGVIFDGLADPLQPVVAVALSSTCLGLRTPLKAALEVLAKQHKRAVKLCSRLNLTCAELPDYVLEHERVVWVSTRLTTDEMATIGMILRRNSLPALVALNLACNDVGDAGLQALCEGLGRGCAPSLRDLNLGFNKFGPGGAEALAAALRRGAMPKLETLRVGNNDIGNQGMAALASSLRKRPAFTHLHLQDCDIDDEGVALLVGDLGKDDFKKLEYLDLNKTVFPPVFSPNTKVITGVGGATLVSAIKAGALPCLKFVFPLVLLETCGTELFNRFLHALK